MTQAGWHWPEPRRMRRLHSLGDHLLWSYAMLCVARIEMKAQDTGTPSPLGDSRIRATTILMSRFQRGERRISSFERDDKAAQAAHPVCAHCGAVAARYHADHLIPRSRLAGVVLAFNQVLSCPTCNLGRGNLDLMVWHRRRQCFPTLTVLRRYLKLCHGYSVSRDLLHHPPADLPDLPFCPMALPRQFPPTRALIYAHSAGGA